MGAVSVHMERAQRGLQLVEFDCLDMEEGSASVLRKRQAFPESQRGCCGNRQLEAGQSAAAGLVIKILLCSRKEHSNFNTIPFSSAPPNRHAYSCGISHIRLILKDFVK